MFEKLNKKGGLSGCWTWKINVSLDRLSLLTSANDAQFTFY
jgi:hypothetical protein